MTSDNIYFRWFMRSLSDNQKKEYREMSINQQKDWYIRYLERHYKISDNNKMEHSIAMTYDSILRSWRNSGVTHQSAVAQAASNVIEMFSGHPKLVKEYLSNLDDADYIKSLLKQIPA